MWAAALAAFLSGASAVEAQEDFEAKTFESKDGGKLLYREFASPGEDSETGVPLVIFFHGAGERGSDNTAQLKHSVGDIAAYLESSGQAGIVVAPQCPEGKQWVDTPWGDWSHTMPLDPSESMRLAIELIDSIVATRPVDPKRIYVTGLSMGGFATWDIVQRRPLFFAAAIPVCGGGDTAEARKLSGLPIWVTHGDRDTVVQTQRSRDMVAALREAGGRPIYTEFEDTGHNAWAPTYSNRAILDWLFSQSK